MTNKCYKFLPTRGGRVYALTIDKTGANLPSPPAGVWKFTGEFNRKPTPAGQSDPVYDELDTKGFVVVHMEFDVSSGRAA
jgi:hypothetical protein